MKINYKKMFDEEINQIKTLDKKPTLLLHACCAPCSSAVLECLRDYFNITLFFYNPNISPESEFIFRLDELKRLTEEMGLSGTHIVSPQYNGLEFDTIAKGLENEPEGGARCAKCYQLRLEKSVSYAKEKEFDYVTTTLSVSPYKNAGWLNEIGQAIAEKYGVKYLYSDFKKGDGYKRSCQLSKEYNLYRQNYCGCVYSKQSAEKENKMKTKTYNYLPSEAKKIREDVFIIEQGFKSEYDEIDDIATHIVLFDGEEAIATCRIYEKSQPGVFMFGRLAVKKELRKKGIGSQVVKAAEEYAKTSGGKSIILHSQLHAKDFYKKLGFAEFGEIEYEQDCPHIWMEKSL